MAATIAPQPPDVLEQRPAAFCTLSFGTIMGHGVELAQLAQVGGEPPTDAEGLDEALQLRLAPNDVRAVVRRDQPARSLHRH